MKITGNYEVDEEIANSLEAVYRDASKAIKKHPKDNLGLTPDHIKSSDEWKAEKRALDIAFQRLQNFNAQYAKHHAARIRIEREKKRHSHIVYATHKP